MAETFRWHCPVCGDSAVICPTLKPHKHTKEDCINHLKGNLYWAEQEIARLKNELTKEKTNKHSISGKNILNKTS